MSLPAFSLRYRPIVVTAVLLLLLWGGYSYATMPRREDPEFIIRTCLVLTNWPGAPTEQVEELVTAPIEDEVNQLDGVRWVRSESSVGRSAVFVELARAMPGGEVEQMWDKVRSRVERVRMPEPGMVPLVIDDFGDTNVMVLALYQRPLPGDTEVRPENRYSPRDLEIFQCLEPLDEAVPLFRRHHGETLALGFDILNSLQRLQTRHDPTPGSVILWMTLGSPWPASS